MPTLSEMFIQGIQKQEGTSLDSAPGAAVGAQLAQVQQAKQAQAAALQKQIQDLEMAKLEKIGGAFNTWANMPEGPGKKIYGEKFVPNLIMSLGWQEKIHPLNLEIMMKDESMGAGVVAGIRQGLYSPQQLQDPNFIATEAPELLKLGSASQIGDFVTNNPKATNEAFNQSQNDKRSTLNARIAAETQLRKQEIDIGTAGSQKFDEKAGADMAKFEQSGGLDEADRDIGEMTKVYEAFNSKKVKTGTLGKKAQSLTPWVNQDTLSDVFDSEFAAIQAKSRSYLKLKDNLDSQFAQQEAEKQYNMRTTNKALSNEANAARANDMRMEMINKRNKAAQMMERMGRLRGPAKYMLGDGKSKVTVQGAKKLLGTVKDPQLRKELTDIIRMGGQ